MGVAKWVEGIEKCEREVVRHEEALLEADVSPALAASLREGIRFHRELIGRYEEKIEEDGGRPRPGM